MEHPEHQISQEHTTLRKLPLFETEKIEHLFCPKDGLMSSVPPLGPILALTNLRIIAFNEGHGAKETTVAPIEEFGAVSVRSQGRNPRNLIQGAGLILVGILSYFIVGLWIAREGLTMPMVVAISIAFVGFLFIMRYIFWEDEGKIVFQGHRNLWELSFPYTSIKASKDIYQVVDHFTKLKLRVTSLRPTEYR